ncbi:hypothetical protein LZ32DRAFT_21463 [Colletotrichum eremochloae]|nr:hypothetical protein LZ32DRAFT_21463 [Colletotrichum eremochloae]
MVLLWNLGCSTRYVVWALAVAALPLRFPKALRKALANPLRMANSADMLHLLAYRNPCQGYTRFANSRQVRDETARE